MQISKAVAKSSDGDNLSWFFVESLGADPEEPELEFERTLEPQNLPR
jgi:hypothetical protein